MGDHGAPSILLSQQVSVNGFSNTSDLVDLQQQAVAGFLLHSSGDTFRVGDLVRIIYF